MTLGESMAVQLVLQNFPNDFIIFSGSSSVSDENDSKQVVVCVTQPAAVA